MERVRVWVTGALIVLGAFVVLILTFPAYDRVLILSGRSEVAAMRIKNPEFGRLAFGAGTWTEPDVQSETGRVSVDLFSGTLVRFVRRGRGPLRLDFEAGPAAVAGDCQAGGKQIGRRSSGGETHALCDLTTARIVMPGDGEPVVIALSGELTVGEEVTQGVSARPMLLQGEASLLVRHSARVFRLLCHLAEHLCDRFTAAKATLSPGDSVYIEPLPERKSAPGSKDPNKAVGFIRIDPANYESGMMFVLSAEARAFKVSRIEGEPYEVQESLFDVVSNSPLVHTLNVTLALVGLVWYFLSLGRSGNSSGGHAAPCIALALVLAGAPGQAWAQQALLKSETNGQAMLRSRGDRCYAITVKHVIGDDTLGTLLAPGRAIGEARLSSTVPAVPEAIALMTVLGLPLNLCPRFEPEPGLDDRLRSHSTAVLRLVRPDGSFELVPLTLGKVDVEMLTVHSARGLMQGMSGGTVLVADQPAGLLTDVRDGGETGRVMRADRIFERLSPHLASIVTPALERGSSKTVPFEVLRSNAEPVSPKNGVSNLQGGTAPWRVTSQPRVELVLHATGPVSLLSLDVSGLPDGPRGAEILGSRAAGGPWQSIASFTLERGDGMSSKRLTATVYPFLLLRLYSMSGEDTLALKSVVLSAP